MPTHYEVTITDAALGDIGSIHDRLTENATFPLYPDRVRDELVTAIDSLATFAERGAPRRDGLRILLTPSSYNIIYRVAGGAVTVLRIRHQRQRWASQA